MKFGALNILGNYHSKTAYPMHSMATDAHDSKMVDPSFFMRQPLIVLKQRPTTFDEVKHSSL